MPWEITWHRHGTTVTVLHVLLARTLAVPLPLSLKPWQFILVASHGVAIARAVVRTMALPRHSHGYSSQRHGPSSQRHGRRQYHGRAMAVRGQCHGRAMERLTLIYRWGFQLSRVAGFAWCFWDHLLRATALPVSAIYSMQLQLSFKPAARCELFVMRKAASTP